MARSDNLTGALLMMASMAAFTLNDTCMKALAGEIPLFQLLFLRGVLTTIFIGIAAWRMGVLRARISRRDWGLIGLRMIAEIGAAYFFLTALFNMPLANVTAILQALPLTITLTAALLFRESIGWRRMSAILIGFVGVMLIVRPGAEDFTIYSFYTLAAVACVTLRDLSTRRLSRETPSMFVTFITSISIMAFFGLAGIGDDWAPMDTRALVLTFGAAIMIIGGYLFSIMVMRVGEISFIAPFRYTGLIWALGLGWLVFGDWPATITLIGASIVVGSGLFMLYREAKIGRKTHHSHVPRPR
ncbi:EamA-like transporter family protein [Roseovarius litorisediminis]|uniref:EamA-like transporter family protein n=1 Tax=Roseovarius litorisediminis TaxID=1312363 RepID=A0A1Y5TVA0_9RHOB|nr:DMT family transporter [Roseovarius litorisediminis]SLN68953.1 EamA-like transporter family protein [Roseovarius litorisediminis]